MRTETILRLGGIRDPATLTPKAAVAHRQKWVLLCAGPRHWKACGCDAVRERELGYGNRFGWSTGATTRERNCMPRVWHELEWNRIQSYNSPVLRNGDGAVRREPRPCGEKELIRQQKSPRNTWKLSMLATENRMEDSAGWASHWRTLGRDIGYLRWTSVLW